jgi:capsid protein
MLGHNKSKAGPAAKPALADRINELRADLDDYIEQCVSEAKRSFPSLPRETLRQSLTGGIGCLCQAASHVIATQQKDQEIAQRQSA